jgi:hypothetical protein
MALKELVAGCAYPDPDPSKGVSFLRVETMLLILNEPHDIRHTIFPAPRTIGLWSPHICDPLMRAIAIRFIDTINSVIGHDMTSLSWTCAYARNQRNQATDNG